MQNDPSQSETIRDTVDNGLLGGELLEADVCASGGRRLHAGNLKGCMSILPFDFDRDDASLVNVSKLTPRQREFGGYFCYHDTVSLLMQVFRADCMILSDRIQPRIKTGLQFRHWTSDFRPQTFL